MSAYGLIAKMRFVISDKLKEVGATSPKTAVTPREANLDFQERQWLEYLAGAFSKIGKTVDRRYYVNINAV